MAKRVGVDKWLYCTTLILVVIGLAMVFSASAVMAKARFGSPYYFVVRQAVWAAAGLAAMTLLMRVDYRKYNRPNVVFPAVAITVIFLMAAFLMRDSHNTHRWIRFGLLSFQPSELAKPALVLFLAWFLQNRMQTIDDWRGTVLPAALPSLVFIVLILKEPDLGTALVCAGVTALMLYLAGMEMKYLGYAALASLPVLYLMLFRVKWRRDRLLAFVNPEADPLGKGFHIIQSLIAVGTGGLHGLGYMEGRQKLFYLPEPHTDYIFANVAEELGLIGAVIVVGLFIVLGYRGMRAAILSKDPFARFLAFGLTATILIQAFFNISVVLALVPTKGITLPFISYGGTSLFIMLACIGVLLNITREIE
ncbi:putative lipid II flippase FtsW [Pseudacidobacterium ailaaui]|jgi:cell division protein FtsW|uniref:putative lipid II flippase FtsW n=1 Tax=Pseudacidobacterium ailaaui TaxID=1382359 RepID=UPI00047ECB9D|nr:putative lipid II flippase FtsW [Pseudacidobacterium ailaaui]MBX6360367.1 putative lipid II flippase FtsW [Pseudacidobacterium ailaaui]MCL6462906.1 putative lipid II flippase FtsW [Pseudacidobacterium ailaaui]MDI3254622.1 putative lipid II flippase FtsW [Bacillota bacterium]